MDFIFKRQSFLLFVILFQIMYLIACFIILTYMVYIWLNKRYNYWADRGINGPKPLPIVGNFKNIILGKEFDQDLITRVYNDYPNNSYVGIYHFLTPTLVVKDLDMIKQVLIKDFNIFHERRLQILYPFDDNADMAEGDTWNVMRGVLTSALTINKLKINIPFLEETADKIFKYVNGLLKSGNIHDIQRIVQMFSFDAAGLFLFGIDFDDYPEHRGPLQDCVDEIFYQGLLSRIIFYLDSMVPGFQKVASLLNIDPRINKIRGSLVPFVNKVMVDKNRRQTFLIDLMIQLKKKPFIEKLHRGTTIQTESTDNLIISQAMVMFSTHAEAPHRIAATAMYLLALYQSIQDRLYREIDQIYKDHGNKITYESLNKMIYLDMVLNEILRKYFGAQLQRLAVSDYEFPGFGLKIKKGSLVMIPTEALHMDPKYFRDPEVFDPERFSPGNKNIIPDCIFGAFGIGPRSCPGVQSSKLVIKFIIASLLLKFKVESCEKMVKKLEYVLGFTKAKIAGGVWLKISERPVSIE